MSRGGLGAWVAVALWAGLGGQAVAAEVAAVLEWSRRVELSTPASGTVAEVLVDVGSRVPRGAALVKLDAGVAEARVSESRALLARAEQEWTDAGRELKRVQELYDRTVISTSELEQAQLRHARASADRDAAKARLNRHSRELAEMVVTAPFDAVVVLRQAEPGQVVASALRPQTLLVVARAGEMLARGVVDARLAQALRPGTAVTVQVQDSRYAGRIRRVGLEPVTERNEYAVDVAFPVKETLRAGMPATLLFP